ncbi:monocarboxylate transporter 12-B-like isoform X2 [Crassostrea virginica]
MKNPWGLVIAVSAFLIQFITFGISLSFGIYIVELQKEFDTSLSLISSIGSINTGFQLVTGTGYCFLYVPSHTLSGLWYDDNRGLVTGIVTSGSALGGVVFPIVIKILIDVYGWRGSMFILAAFNFQTILLAGLLRESPLQREWKKSKTKNIESSIADSTATIYTVYEDNGNTKNHQESISTDNFPSQQVKHETEIPIIKEKSTLMKLLTNVPYILFTINNFLWNAGASVAMLLGPDYYTKIGHSLTEAAVLLSVSQGTMLCGCVVGGILGNYRNINRNVLFLCMNFIMGLCTFAYTFPVLQTMTGLVTVNCLFGLSLGISLGLLVIIVSVFVGSQLIGDGIGYLMLASGVGCFIGPPIGSYLSQSTGSYDATFYMTGSANLMSGLVLLVIPIKDCLRHSKGYTVSSNMKWR